MIKKLFPGLILLFILVLSSCNPFTTNLYSGIDKFKNPDLSNSNALLDAADEPQFYKNLTDDPAAKEQVLNTLQEVLDDPDASNEKKQEAALMVTNVHLKTSNTEGTMSNLNSLVGDAVSGKEVFDGSGDGPETFFRAIFGEPPATSVMSFAAYKATVIIQLNAFLAAAEPLQQYGETLEITNKSPPGTNNGDNATKALMAGMTRTLVYYIDAPLKTERVDILAKYLATPKNADGSIPYTINYREGPGGIPDFTGPTDMLVDPADPTNPAKDGLKKVVSFGGLDLDSLF